MVICIELDIKTKDDLDQLLKVGEYRDYSQAIAIAVSNQLVLHQKVKEQGRYVVLDEIPDGAQRQGARSPVRSATRGIPPAFALSEIAAADYEAAPVPSDAFVPGSTVPVDRWIFGQHNKLLPAKASCRALAMRLADGRGISLAKAASEIAADAVQLGDYLRSVDEKNGLGRDEALSIAFPSSDSKTGDKARLRYGNQFVASMNKQGQLSGLLVDLKFVNLTRSRDARLSLTAQGWEFARMDNPVLDRDAVGPSKFSDEEVEFLLGHVRLHVPAEDSAYRTVLQALTGGNNTPEKLDTFLRQFLSDRREKPFTDAFLATQRSGVISRMADLGLVERQRDGIRVTYVPTDRAIQYSNNIPQEVGSV